MDPSDGNLNSERQEENNECSIETSSTDHSGRTTSSFSQNIRLRCRMKRSRSLDALLPVEEGLQLNNLIRESERPKRRSSESDVAESNNGIQEFRQTLSQNRTPRHLLTNAQGTPSAQNEAAISHADQDQDSRSDLSSVLSVELNVGPNTNNQDPTRDSTLTGNSALTGTTVTPLVLFFKINFWIFETVF